MSNSSRKSHSAIVFFALILLLFGEGLCKCNFAKSTGFSTPHAGSYSLFFGDSLDMSKPGYYISLENTTNLGDNESGTFYGFMPLSGDLGNVSYARSLLPEILGPETYKVIQAREEDIKAIRPQLKNACQKKLTFPEDLTALVKKFFEKNSMSIVSKWGTINLGGLHIIRIDESHNRTFLDIEHLKYLEECNVSNEFFQEYLTLYKEIRTLFERNMEQCKVVCIENDCKLETQSEGK